MNSPKEVLSKVFCCGRRASMPSVTWRFLAFHFLAICAVYTKFAFQKYNDKLDQIPEAAPFRWQKVWVPTLEFGAMHCLMLQMTLLPLTMSHVTLTWLSKFRILHYVVPFHDMRFIHKFWGIVMFVQLTLGTLLFFFHLGSLCAYHKSGEEPSEEPCRLLTSEIMLTGYAIYIATCIMFFTSLPSIRRKYYDFFYRVHQVVFIILSAIAIAHTFDNKQRKGQVDRSQIFKFTAWAVGWYLLDRLYMWYFQRYDLKVAHLFVQNKPKSIEIHLEKPLGWSASPGQNVYLRVKEVSKTQFHPFAIISVPDEGLIRIFVQVHRGGWTEQLWRACGGVDGQGASLLPTDVVPTKRETFTGRTAARGGKNEDVEGHGAGVVDLPSMEVMGPYGPGLSGPVNLMVTDDHDALMVASNSGIVPVVSALLWMVKGYVSEGAAGLRACSSNNASGLSLEGIGQSLRQSAVGAITSSRRERNGTGNGSCEGDGGGPAGGRMDLFPSGRSNFSTSSFRLRTTKIIWRISSADYILWVADELASIAQMMGGYHKFSLEIYCTREEEMERARAVARSAGISATVDPFKDHGWEKVLAVGSVLKPTSSNYGRWLQQTEEKVKKGQREVQEADVRVAEFIQPPIPVERNAEEEKEGRAKDCEGKSATDATLDHTFASFGVSAYINGLQRAIFSNNASDLQSERGHPASPSAASVVDTIAEVGAEEDRSTADGDGTSSTSMEDGEGVGSGLVTVDACERGRKSNKGKGFDKSSFNPKLTVICAPHHKRNIRDIVAQNFPAAEVLCL